MLEPELLATLLKTIKNLTMLPTSLEVLQNANAIDVIVRVLRRSFEGRIAAVRCLCHLACDEKFSAR